MTVTPTQTARDLRNAAYVVSTAGHTTNEFIEPTTGQVCAAGAIGVATGYFEYTRVTDRYGDPCFPQTEHEEFEDRHAAAIRALAPLLTTDCHGTCGHGDHAAVHGYHERLAHTPGERVYHYNDFICEGGEHLEELLVTAAEKIEAQEGTLP